MKTSLLLSIISLTVVNSFCQNLVLNPSFEETDSKFIVKKSNPEGVKFWRVHNPGGVSFLSKAFCEQNTYNCYGLNEAKSGKACAAPWLFRTYAFSYLQGVLHEPLQKGEIYKVEFYYKLSDSANVATREINVALTPKVLGSYEGKSSYPWVITDKRKYPESRKEWRHFSYEYIAIGGEKVISIGYMGRNRNIHDVKYDMVDAAYWEARNITTEYEKKRYPRKAIYFIDDVSVIKTGQVDELGRLSSIYFENNSTILPVNSQEKLNKLFKLKASNLSNYNIVVEGFADQNGETTDNDILSQKRAKSVADYLINKGMPSDRIEIKAYGESLAKGIDDTSDRRVDIYLHKRP